MLASQIPPSARSAELMKELDAAELEKQTRALFAKHMRANYRRVDGWFLYLMVFQWMFAVMLAVVVSPASWQGKIQSLHDHVPVALFGGGLLSLAPIAMIKLYPGSTLTRWVVALAQMLWSALLIHLTGGRIETHFHVFGSLAFLAFYRDFRVLIPAAIVVAVDHFVRQMLWPESVYGIGNPEWWRFLEHAGWVVFEDVILIVACVSAVQEERVRCKQQVIIERTEDVQREMDIAARIQQSILPKDLTNEGLDISAAMIPAARVGGDYYDVLSVPGGCWIAVGDVAGHGVTAGLVMMQTQSVIATLIRNTPAASPSAILSAANAILYENIRIRMLQDEFITLSLIFHKRDGTVVMSGAHEEAIVVRAGTRAVERLDVVGTWLGAKADVGPHLADTTISLREGDLLVLYTDGITEARNAAKKEFGMDRLCDAIVEVSHEPVDQIRDHILAKLNRWTGERRQDDDVTLVVLRQIAPGLRVAPDGTGRPALASA